MPSLHLFARTSLTRKFFSSVSITNDDILVMQTECGEIDQLCILSCTFLHTRYKSYPPSTKFCKLFAKYLIDLIEKRCEEVLVDLYNIYVSILSRDGSQQFAFKSYLLQDSNEGDDWLVLKESSNVISNGTTGLSAWQAAYYLSEWVAQNREFLKNKSVIELGSGTGLAGLVMYKLVQPKKFIFTDHHSEVLSVLEENLKLNGLMQSGYDVPSVDILALDWETVSDEFIQEINKMVDVIIASDVVFDTRLIPSLVKVIKGLLNNLSSSSDKKAYICSAIRNRDTWNCFVEECKKASMIVDKIEFALPSDEKKLFHSVNYLSDIEIVRLAIEAV